MINKHLEEVSHSTSLLIIGSLRSKILLGTLGGLATLLPVALYKSGILEQYTFQTLVIEILGMALIWFFVVGLIYRFCTKKKISALAVRVSELEEKTSSLSSDLAEAKNNQVVIRRGNANNSLGDLFRR